MESIKNKIIKSLAYKELEKDVIKEIIKRKRIRSRVYGDSKNAAEERRAEEEARKKIDELEPEIDDEISNEDYEDSESSEDIETEGEPEELDFSGDEFLGDEFGFSSAEDDEIVNRSQSATQKKSAPVDVDQIPSDKDTSIESEIEDEDIKLDDLKPSVTDLKSASELEAEIDLEEEESLNKIYKDLLGDDPELLKTLDKEKSDLAKEMSDYDPDIEEEIEKDDRFADSNDSFFLRPTSYTPSINLLRIGSDYQEFIKNSIVPEIHKIKKIRNKEKPYDKGEIKEETIVKQINDKFFYYYNKNIKNLQDKSEYDKLYKRFDDLYRKMFEILYGEVFVKEQNVNLENFLRIQKKRAIFQANDKRMNKQLNYIEPHLRKIIESENNLFKKRFFILDTIIKDYSVAYEMYASFYTDVIKGEDKSKEAVFYRVKKKRMGHVQRAEEVTDKKILELKQEFANKRRDIELLCKQFLEVRGKDNADSKQFDVLLKNFYDSNFVNEKIKEFKKQLSSRDKEIEIINSQVSLLDKDIEDAQEEDRKIRQSKKKAGKNLGEDKNLKFYIRSLKKQKQRLVDKKEYLKYLDTDITYLGADTPNEYVDLNIFKKLINVYKDKINKKFFGDNKEKYIKDQNISRFRSMNNDQKKGLENKNPKLYNALSTYNNVYNSLVILNQSKINKNLDSEVDGAKLDDILEPIGEEQVDQEALLKVKNSNAYKVVKKNLESEFKRLNAKRRKEINNKFSFYSTLDAMFPKDEVQSKIEDVLSTEEANEVKKEVGDYFKDLLKKSETSWKENVDDPDYYMTEEEIKAKGLSYKYISDTPAYYSFYMNQNINDIKRLEKEISQNPDKFSEDQKEAFKLFKKNFEEDMEISKKRSAISLKPIDSAIADIKKLTKDESKLKSISEIESFSKASELLDKTILDRGKATLSEIASLNQNTDLAQESTAGVRQDFIKTLKRTRWLSSNPLEAARIIHMLLEANAQYFITTGLSSDETGNIYNINDLTDDELATVYLDSMTELRETFSDDDIKEELIKRFNNPTLNTKEEAKLYVINNLENVYNEEDYLKALEDKRLAKEKSEKSDDEFYSLVMSKITEENTMRYLDLTKEYYEHGYAGTGLENQIIFSETKDKEEVINTYDALFDRTSSFRNFITETLLSYYKSLHQYTLKCLYNEIASYFQERVDGFLQGFTPVDMSQFNNKKDYMEAYKFNDRNKTSGIGANIITKFPPILMHDSYHKEINFKFSKFDDILKISDKAALEVKNRVSSVIGSDEENFFGKITDEVVGEFLLHASDPHTRIGALRKRYLTLVHGERDVMERWMCSGDMRVSLINKETFNSFDRNSKVRYINHIEEYEKTKTNRETRKKELKINRGKYFNELFVKSLFYSNIEYMKNYFEDIKYNILVFKYCKDPKSVTKYFTNSIVGIKNDNTIKFDNENEEKEFRNNMIARNSLSRERIIETSKNINDFYDLTHGKDLFKLNPEEKNEIKSLKSKLPKEISEVLSKYILKYSNQNDKDTWLKNFSDFGFAHLESKSKEYKNDIENLIKNFKKYYEITDYDSLGGQETFDAIELYPSFVSHEDLLSLLDEYDNK